MDVFKLEKELLDKGYYLKTVKEEFTNENGQFTVVITKAKAKIPMTDITFMGVRLNEYQLKVYQKFKAVCFSEEHLFMSFKRYLKKHGFLED